MQCRARRFVQILQGEQLQIAEHPAPVSSPNAMLWPIRIHTTVTTPSATKFCWIITNVLRLLTIPA